MVAGVLQGHAPTCVSGVSRVSNEEPCHLTCDFTQVVGKGAYQLRSDDPTFLSLVDRWWNVLLPRMAPYLYERGGNIVMVQVT